MNRSQANRRLREGRLAKMHAVYGRRDGEKCGDCARLVVRRFAGEYLKCELVGTTGSASTDWRVNFVACGKFEKRSA